MALVRPVEDERLLQRLDDLTNEELREEFVEQIEQLRARVFKKAKVKLVDGQPINGPMLCELAQSYITAMNQGKIPTIESALTYVQQAEMRRTFERIMSKFDKEFNERVISRLPTKDEKINKYVDEYKKEMIADFTSQLLGGDKNPKFGEFIEQIKKKFREEKEKAKKLNNDSVKKHT